MSFATDRDTTDAIKTTAIAALVEADRDVRIHRTEYFNHTYVPDLVLRWPKEGLERSVFLRTTTNPEYLLEDVSYMDDQNAIIMPLADLRAESEPQVDKSRALISGVPAFTALARAKSSNPIVDLASRALLQGGSGFVDTKDAINFGRAIATGFDAAQEGESEATSDALLAADELLDPNRSSQIGDFLHAVWVGSGSDGTSFPGQSGLSARLSASALMLLLDSVDIDDPMFWKRVGGNLTLAKLIGLEIPTDHANFQRLVGANAADLRAKVCRIVDAPQGEKDRARWFASDGDLGLRLERFTFLFSDKKIADLPASVSPDSVSVDNLQDRAGAREVTVSEVVISEGPRRLNYATSDGTSIFQDTRLSEIGSTMGRDALVTSASLSLPGKTMSIDFRTSTIRGETVARYTLPEFSEVGIPMLAQLDRTERALVSAAIGVDSPRESPTQSTSALLETPPDR